MKTIKFILPALAFCFAIAASLATVNAKGSMLETKRISLPSPDACEDIGSCTTGGSVLCQNTAGTIIYREYITGTTCGSSFNGTKNP